MKALRIHGIKNVRVDTVDDPTIEAARDAIIRVTSTAIFGSDRHIFNGAAVAVAAAHAGHVSGTGPLKGLKWEARTRKLLI